MTTLNERISEEMAADRQRDLDKLQERINFTTGILQRLATIEAELVSLRNDLILERADVDRNAPPPRELEYTADDDGHFDRQGHVQEAAGL